MSRGLGYVAWQLPALESISSGHKYLSRYEWDMSRLDKQMLSGLIEAYAAAPDLMMQQHCPIERATMLPSVLFSTRLIFQILAGSVWSGRAMEFISQIRQSLAHMGVSWISSQSYVSAEHLGHSLAKDNCLGLSMVRLREYNAGWWYEARSIPAHWFVMEWQLQESPVQRWGGACDWIYVCIVSAGCWLNLWHIGTTLLFEESAFRSNMDACSDYLAIWEQDVQVEVMTCYILSCGWDLILFTRVML